MNLSAYNDIQNFINGEFYPTKSGNYLDNINPATAEVIGKIPDSNERDVADAVEAAKKAFQGWSTTTVEKRFQVLNRISTLIDEHLAELALAETIDNGKPLWLSKKVDIPRASANFRFFATGIMGVVSEVAPSGQALPRALEIAREIAAMPPISIMQIKEIVNAGLNAPLETALMLERKAFQLQFATRDQKEGMRAFMEKRKPKFEGQ